jgi:DNA polymerase III gamma/tau subunit
LGIIRKLFLVNKKPSMSLANKYRPQTFDAIIGQEHITEILKAQMQSAREMHHNYLLF